MRKFIGSLGLVLGLAAVAAGASGGIDTPSDGGKLTSRTFQVEGWWFCPDAWGGLPAQIRVRALVNRPRAGFPGETRWELLAEAQMTVDTYEGSGGLFYGEVTLNAGDPIGPGVADGEAVELELWIDYPVLREGPGPGMESIEIVPEYLGSTHVTYDPD